jgi:cysteinyl-tRNA synthetase
MNLSLYNTLTRQQEPFEPLEPNQVRMYCCGVTVYDYCHLGHARSYIVWDVVRRYLQWCGYQVRYVQNFTDIDDKILNRAKQEHSSMQAVAEQFIAAYQEDMAKLNILPADAYPRATDVIPQIIDLVRSLETQGYAYAADGDVYYAVERFPTYGKLSGRQLDQLEVGGSGRVDEAEPKKRYPLDFALWKAARPDETSVYTPWNSPWGPGRPGWHIECSAMVQDALGDTIDIHMGGMDLIFPHHENEIAQSEAATRQPLARYWLHNGFVNIDSVKMSKSLGNFKTIRDLLKIYEPMVLRLFILQASYRKPIDFTEAAMTSAENSWHTLREGLLFGFRQGAALGWQTADSAIDTNDLDAEAVQRFQDAMDDDFNTPVALSVLFESAKDLKRESNRLVHEGQTDTSLTVLKQQWKTLRYLASVLGLDAQPDAETSNTELGISDADVEALIQQRQAARQAKDFAESDRIRNELKTKGITLIDQPGEMTRWHR